MRPSTPLPLLALLLAFVAAMLSCPQPGDAQAPPAAEVPAAQAPTPDVRIGDLESLAATLEDEGKRGELLRAVQALIAAKQQAEPAAVPALGDRVLDYAAGAAREAQDAIAEAAGYFSDWPVLLNWIKREWSDPAARAKGAREAFSFVAIFVVGWLAELLLWRLLTGTRRHLDGVARRSGVGRVLPIVSRTLVDLLPPVAFFGAAYATALVVEPTRVVRAVSLNFVNAYLVARGLMAFTRLLLAPGSPALRLLPLADRLARDLFVWTRRFVYTAVTGYFVIAASFLLGMPRRGADALLTGLGLALVVIAIVFVLRHRRPAAAWLHRRAAAASQRFGGAQMLYGFASVWHILAIAYVIGFFAVAAFGIEGGFTYMLRCTLLSLLVIAAAWLVLLGTHRLLEALRRPGAHPTAQSQVATAALRSRLLFYLPAIDTVARIIFVAAALFALLEVWGIDALAWLQYPFGQRALGATLSIALVLASAVVVWEVAGNAIERYLTRQTQEGTAMQRSARMRTLLPLLRKALFVLLTVMVALITLSEIGVNIAPLLAGAGVVGLAIGFGAQKLVQDVITGIFMLVEDAISVGDVVNVAGVGGLVEDLSIRSIRLRDLAGNVHTVPFSSVGTVTNMTKGFSYYVFNISVDYREDTDRVSEVCKQIAEEMRADSQFASDILEPLEVFGVDQFADSAVIIQARVKTRPIRQWAVGREFNRRMKKRFAEVGIEIPYPHRTVYLGVEGKDDHLPLHVHLEGWPGAATGEASDGRKPAAAPSANGDGGRQVEEEQPPPRAARVRVTQKLRRDLPSPQED